MVTVQCENWGRRHKRKQCPAYGQECLVCYKLNHFSRVCQSRPIVSQGNNLPTTTRRCSSSQTINEIEQSNTVSDHTAEESQDLFIESLQVNGLDKSTAWFADLDTSGGQLHMKLDTGVEVSALPSKIYEDLWPPPTLNKTNLTLTAYGGMSIQPHGICQLTCGMPGYANTSEINFYVTPVNAHLIFGLNDCVQLGLIKHVYQNSRRAIDKTVITGEIPHCVY